MTTALDVDVEPEALGELSEEESALVVALGSFDHAAEAWDPDLHPRGERGRFISIVSRLTANIEQHRGGNGDGHPFDGFSREQLRRVARARGVELERGESRDSIAAKLLAHLDNGHSGHGGHRRSDGQAGFAGSAGPTDWAQPGSSGHADHQTVMKFLRAEYGPSVSDATLAATADEMSPSEVASVVAAAKVQPHLTKPSGSPKQPSGRGNGKVSKLSDEQIENGLVMHGNQSPTGKALQAEQSRRSDGQAGFAGSAGSTDWAQPGHPANPVSVRADGQAGFAGSAGSRPKTVPSPARPSQSAKALPSESNRRSDGQAGFAGSAGSTDWAQPAKGMKTMRKRATHATEPELDERTVEATDHIEGHVVEALESDGNGGRVFRVRIIREGTSKNRKRYTEAVLRNAAPLYEGAKAFDHHRTPAEMQTSTVAGLVGGYRNVAYDGDGLYGDLHLLPSATHTAEALDASIAALTQGLPPLVGISHDVLASFRPGSTGHVQEAVAITKVHSADVVADPSAGGQATRVLAGGIDDTEECDVPVTTEAVLDALKTAGDEQLAAVGLTRVSPTTEATQPEPERATEAGEPKTSVLAAVLIRQKLDEAGLSAIRESFTARLPERITEADIDHAIAAYKDVIADAERAGLRPTVTTQVTQEAHDKKVEALDAFFAGDHGKGYRSFRQAWGDFTNYRGSGLDLADLNRRILRESFGGGFASGERATESLTASSWDVVLGDSITRRMVAQYAHPSLQNWRQIVSSTPPVNDFRTQRIDRIGGYGTLPAVAEGAPYQPLTSPADEEVTYAITKRGGTEDLTLEMVANDDVRAIANIPRKLGLAAARTLHNFVWDFLATNPTIYDSVTLFHATHTNTTAVALSQSNLSTLRQKMRDQTAYGDTSDILSLVPRFLVVPNELEELAFQLVSSAVAVPATPAGPSDTPNLHSGMTHIVVDYLTDANDWYVVADPSLCPTIEIGFYQGRQEPELFTQSDQTVGSMFNADKITYKIRHIYSGAVLDYRGMQRGTQ